MKNEKFEGTKGVDRRCKLTDRQHNGQTEKRRKYYWNVVETGVKLHKPTQTKTSQYTETVKQR